jgi:DNA-binding transcriptional LysR family regulator
VARSGGLGAAASALRVSEATVGRHLRALEEELGAPLFDRLPNRLALTRLGAGLVEAAGAMEEEALRFERAARAGAAAPGEPVRVTATTSVALFVARHLDRLLAALPPGVQLRLSGTRAPLSLARREAEIALRMRRPPERGELAVRRVGSVAFSLYAARGHLDRRGWAEGDDLRRLDFVGLRDEPESRQARWLDGGRRRRADAAAPRRGAASLEAAPPRAGRHAAALLPRRRRDRPPPPAAPAAGAGRGGVPARPRRLQVGPGRSRGRVGAGGTVSRRGGGAARRRAPANRRGGSQRRKVLSSTLISQIGITITAPRRT